MPDSSLTMVTGTRPRISSAALSATRSIAYWPGRSVRARRSAPVIGATASRIATAVLSNRVRSDSGMLPVSLADGAGRGRVGYFGRISTIAL